MRELWQQSKPCLGHWARARHDGTGGACVKTCWKQVETGYPRVFERRWSRACFVVRLAWRWGGLSWTRCIRCPFSKLLELLRLGMIWISRNGGMELHSSKSVARARRKAFTWTCWWAPMRRNMHPMSVPQWMTDHRLRCFECLNYIINILYSIYSYNNIFIFAIIHHVCSEWTEMDGGTMTGG